MTYVFDLDGTLCTTEGRDYINAEPIDARIAEVRRLKADGHTVLIDTARGSGTGINWRALTLLQLQMWGVPCDELRVGRKPAGDLYIDDKGVRADDFFNLEA